MSSAEAIWHELECGRYTEDLSLWRQLADRVGGPILDVGAGTGRTTLELATAGHAVLALDLDDALLAVLRERAEGLEVRTLVGDARAFWLGETFRLCIVPMQTIQLLGGAEGRLQFFECAREHLEPRGVLAVAVAETARHLRDRRGPARPAARRRRVRRRRLLEPSHRGACRGRRFRARAPPRDGQLRRAAVDRDQPHPPRPGDRGDAGGRGEQAGLSTSTGCGSRPPRSTWARRWCCSCCPDRRALRVCALYPDLMNIYADRGNLLLLEQRCRWRGLGFSVVVQRPGRGARSRRAPTCTTSAAARTATRSCAPRTWRTPSARPFMRRLLAARSSSRCAAAISCSATPTSSATRRCRASVWWTSRRSAPRSAEID